MQTWKVITDWTKLSSRIQFMNSDRGISTEVVVGGGGEWWNTNYQPNHHCLASISEPIKVQQFQFITSRVLLFTGVQQLYGSEIARFLSIMLQFLDNLRQLFIFF